MLRLRAFSRDAATGRKKKSIIRVGTIHKRCLLSKPNVGLSFSSNAASTGWSEMRTLLGAGQADDGSTSALLRTARKHVLSHFRSVLGVRKKSRVNNYQKMASNLLRNTLSIAF